MNVMIDLETLSVRANALILTIGAIKFNTKYSLKSLDKMDTFYRRITIDSCREIGCHEDPETQKWWDEQDSVAREEAFSPKDRIPIKQALQELSKWFGKDKYTKVYAHSPNFDITILDEAYKNCGLMPPWNFWNVRCTRTIYCLGNIRMSDLPANNKHHAIDDCYRQIIGVYKSYKNIGFLT